MDAHSSKMNIPGPTIETTQPRNPEAWSEICHYFERIIDYLSHTPAPERAMIDQYRDTLRDIHGELQPNQPDEKRYRHWLYKERTRPANTTVEVTGPGKSLAGLICRVIEMMHSELDKEEATSDSDSEDELSESRAARRRRRKELSRVYDKAYAMAGEWRREEWAESCE